MHNPPLRAQLGRLARRVRGLGGVLGLGCGLLAAGLTVLAGAWADLVFELSPALRLAALCAALLVGPALALAVLWRCGRRALPAVLARRLDQIASARGEIVAGVDLLDDSRKFNPLESGLAVMAIERAAALARDVPGSRVAPARPSLVPSLFVVLLAGGAALLALGLPRMAQAVWLRFSDPFGDHPPYSAVLLDVEPGDVKVIYGDGVEIRAHASGAPVDRLELVLEPAGQAAERLPMFPEGDGRWRAAVANVTAPGRYFVRADRARARSPRHAIEVITVPALKSVRFRVTPPAYTRRSAYLGPAPADGLAGLPGTRVEAWATSNRPLASGTLQVAAAEATRSIELVPTGQAAHEVYGSFEIRADGKLDLRVRDVAGQQSRDAFSASVVLLRDERPFIRITEPREVSFATPDVALPVALVAEDDYGIARVQLFRALNGSRASPVDLAVRRESPTQWSDQPYLPLAEYGLKPGDEISLFARVEDNDPAGAKGSETAVVRVRIIPREVYEQMVRARDGIDALAARYREAQRRLEALAEEIDQLRAELEKLPPGTTLASAHEAKLNDLARQFRDETAAIRESAKHPLPYDIDRNLSRELESLAKSLEQLSREAEQLAKDAGQKNGAAAERLAELARRLGLGRKDLKDKALAPIEHLALVYPLIEDQARFVQLYFRQRDLAVRTDALKGKDGADDPARKARMRDLEAEQKQIRTELARLLDDIEDHARLLPEDPQLAALRETAQSFVASVRASGASEAMTDAEAALAAFAGTRSFESTRKAADILETLIAQCSGDGAMGQACEGSLKFQPALPGNLGNSIAQMLASAGLPLPGQFGKPGSGMGAGTGDGFSARQNNLKNVGLYGSMPTLAASDRRGSGQSAAARGLAGSGGSTAARRAPETTAASSALRAAGQAQTTVPAPYRRRVADYFQRIADEIGDR